MYRQSYFGQHAECESIHVLTVPSSRLISRGKIEQREETTSSDEIDASPSISRTVRTDHFPALPQCAFDSMYHMFTIFALEAHTKIVQMHTKPQNKHNHTTPTTTVARKLPSFEIDRESPVHPSTPFSRLSSPVPFMAEPGVFPEDPRFVRYSSDLSADDFQPHDWEIVKLSGAEENLMTAVPRAEAHEMEK